MSIAYKNSPIKDSSEYKRVQLSRNDNAINMDFMYDSETRTPIYETYVKSFSSMFNDDNDNNNNSDNNNENQKDAYEDGTLNMVDNLMQGKIPETPVTINLNTEATGGRRLMPDPVALTPDLITDSVSSMQEINHEVQTSSDEDDSKDDKQDEVEEASIQIDIDDAFQKYHAYINNIEEKFPECTMNQSDYRRGNSALHDGMSLHEQQRNLDQLSLEVMKKVSNLDKCTIAALDGILMFVFNCMLWVCTAALSPGRCWHLGAQCSDSQKCSKKLQFMKLQ